MRSTFEGKPLPSVVEIRKSEKQAKNDLWRLFSRNLSLREYPQHLVLGLTRLTEKAEIAITMIEHMNARGICSVEELAEKLYIGRDGLEVLGWMRYPCAFRNTADPDTKRRNDYLLALCDLERDYKTKKFVPITPERP